MDLLIPKKLTKVEMYNSVIFVLLLQLITDVVFSLKYNLYGYFQEGLELIAFFVFWGIYPAFSIVMLNYFPFHKKFASKVLYVICVTIFCVFYEWLSVKAKFFYHDEWKFLYSVLSYPSLIATLAIELTLFRKLMDKS